MKNLNTQLMSLFKIRRCVLFSCSNKSGINALARYFQNRDFDIISTGGTYNVLKKDAYINPSRLIPVEKVTQFPEMLDGRVKTLHPNIHAGILAKRDDSSHINILDQYRIPRIDVVVSNLYPFKDIVTKHSDKSIEQIIEYIDIGGVTLTRAAAKNYEHVTILTDPKQYQNVCKNFDSFTVTDRFKLALEAFRVTRTYDNDVYQWMYNYALNPKNVSDQRRQSSSTIHKRNLHTNIALFTKYINTRTYTPRFDLKYGSNPHQNLPGGSRVYSIDKDEHSFPFSTINGTPSYINMLDAINSWQLVNDLSGRFNNCIAAASYKHTSPAGAAIVVNDDFKKYPEANGDTALIAYIKARNGDPMCSFGDFIAISNCVTPELAKYIAPLVSDGIIASDFDPKAIDILKKKKKGNYVILSAELNSKIPDIEYREMYGIAISQPVNHETIQWNDLRESNIVTKRKTLTSLEKEDLMLANMSLKYAQSNNVAIAFEGQLIGISAGQQSRIHSVRLATRKAQVWLLRNEVNINDYFKQIKDKMCYQDAVNVKMRIIEHFLGDVLTYNETALYYEKYGIDNKFLNGLRQIISDYSNTHASLSLSSDAYFPFRDSIDCASKIGVTAISQPGGSIRDENVINACDEYKMTMICHNKRMFTH
jgi:phosphoribosylaminoimidazolecarboxamide formyltransferase / IMP cyclohydrolase